MAAVNCSVDELEAVAREGAFNLVPVWRELVADLETPVSALLKLCGPEAKYAFLLESVVGGESVARFSFIGGERTRPPRVAAAATPSRTRARARPQWTWPRC